MINNFLECNKQILDESKLCKNCWDNNRSKYPQNYIQPTKIEWDNNYLLNLLQTKSFVETSKILGVSNSAIRKHLKTIGLNPSDIVKQRRSNTNI